MQVHELVIAVTDGRRNKTAGSDPSASPIPLIAPSGRMRTHSRSTLSRRRIVSRYPRSVNFADLLCSEKGEKPEIKAIKREIEYDAIKVQVLRALAGSPPSGVWFQSRNKLMKL